MSMIIKLFPEGKKKALTLSYDDGVAQDIRLVGIFNKYGLKATFNINSGIQNRNNYWDSNGVRIERMDVDGLKELYQGHEVAVHSLTHPFLEKIPKEMLITEIFEDRKGLEKMFGYPVRGMAYPFGTYNAAVIDVLRTCGIEYSRTVEQHEKFSLPDNFLTWHPTCHHRNPRLMDLAREFIDGSYQFMTLFYVWGHSYEFDLDNNWELIEDFCSLVSKRNDIWYSSNIEIIDYMSALNSLKFSADCSMVYNPSALKVWLGIKGQVIGIMPGETVKLTLTR